MCRWFEIPFDFHNHYITNVYELHSLYLIIFCFLLLACCCAFLHSALLDGYCVVVSASAVLYT